MTIEIILNDFYTNNNKTATIFTEFCVFHNVLLTEKSNLESGKAVLKIVVNKRGQLTVLCIG